MTRRWTRMSTRRINRMPKAFTRCVKAGGKVRTIKPKGQKSRTYMRVCRLGPGKSVGGEVKKRKPK